MVEIRYPDQPLFLFFILACKVDVLQWLLVHKVGAHQRLALVGHQTDVLKDPSETQRAEGARGKNLRSKGWREARCAD